MLLLAAPALAATPLLTSSCRSTARAARLASPTAPPALWRPDHGSSMAWAVGPAILREPGATTVAVDAPLFDQRWWFAPGLGIDERASFVLSDEFDFASHVAFAWGLAPEGRVAPYLLAGVAAAVLDEQDFVMGPTAALGLEAAIAPCYALDLRVQYAGLIGDSEGITHGFVALAGLRVYM